MAADLFRSGVSITFDSRGVPTLDIPDSKGEIHSYSMTRLDGVTALWAVQLTRLDAEEAVYRVALDMGRTWRCTCKDAQFRPRGEKKRLCKHATAARDLKRLLDLLAAPPVPVSEWAGLDG